MSKPYYRPAERTLAVLTLLKEYPDGLRPKDAIEKLEKRMELNEYEQGSFESGTPRFGRLIRFATIGAVKSGWMIKDGRTWSITPAGLEASSKYSTGEEIQKNMHKLYCQ